MCSVRALHAACRWPGARSSLPILGALVVLVLGCWRPICGTAAGAQSVRSPRVRVGSAVQRIVPVRLPSAFRVAPARQRVLAARGCVSVRSACGGPTGHRRTLATPLFTPSCRGRALPQLFRRDCRRSRASSSPSRRAPACCALRRPLHTSQPLRVSRRAHGSGWVRLGCARPERVAGATQPSGLK